MIITGMAHFESVAQKKLVEWYHKNRPEVQIDRSNVFVVWSCKTLQNYKCLASTTISGDGIYAEYTYNGDKQELYEDVYVHRCRCCAPCRGRCVLRPRWEATLPKPLVRSAQPNTRFAFVRLHIACYPLTERRCSP